eukprot:403331514
MATIITSATNQREFILEQWLVRSFSCLYHLLLILSTWKFPVLTNFHAPILVLNYLMNLYQVVPNKASIPAIMNNVSGFSFFMVSGLVTNSRWLYTSISFTVVLISTMVFYSYFINVNEVAVMIQFVSITVIVTYASYQYEFFMKKALLRMEQVNRMNEDLQAILMNFPEGIVLYDQNNGKIMLANQEMKRIFKLNRRVRDDTNLIEEKINQNNLVPVNMLNQKITKKNEQQKVTGQQLIENKNGLISALSVSQQSTQRVSLVEAAQKFSDGQTFQIDDQLRVLDQESQNFLDQLETQQNASRREEGSGDPIHSQQLITIKESKILFQNTTLRMIMIKSLTPMMKYEKLKLENHFYEMLTATVSHDMRTPLNAMCGLISNIESFIVGDSGQRLLKIVKSSSKILLFLVNDLLDFTQIRNNKFRKNEKPCNIKETIKEAIDIIQLAVEEKGLSLLYKYDNNIPNELITDSQRINQIVLNLLQNALKFTSKGQISLHLKYDEMMHKLIFIVKDQGIGIKQEDKQKLFTLFGKLEATASINTSGIGLGLSICKKIVESFGGQIFIEDNKDEPGSSFTFTIKCKGDEGDVDFVSQLHSNRSIITNEQIQLDKLNLIDNDQQMQTEQGEEEKLNEINNLINDDECNASDESYVLDSHRNLNSPIYNSNPRTHQIQTQIYSHGINNNAPILLQKQQPNYKKKSLNLLFQNQLEPLQQIIQQKSLQDQQLETREINGKKGIINLNRERLISRLPCPCSSRQDILIVDDNIFNIVTIQTILEFQYGLTSDKAMNGEEALEKVQQRAELNKSCPCYCSQNRKNYKLIFMDCNMPVMDGFQATQQIKKLCGQDGFQIYIIALTAYTTDNFKARAKDSGMDNFLTKPIYADQLKQILLDRGQIEQNNE